MHRNRLNFQKEKKAPKTKTKRRPTTVIREKHCQISTTKTLRYKAVSLKYTCTVENYEQKRKDITIRYDNDVTSLYPFLISFAFCFSQHFVWFFCMLPSFLQHEATCPRIQRETIRTGMREIDI